MESLADSGVDSCNVPTMLRICKYLWLKFYLFFKILLFFMFRFFY